MTISLNDKVIQASGVSLGEVLFMIAVQNSIDLEEAKSDLLNKGFIGEAYNRETYLPEGYFITRTGGTILNNIILDSDKLTGSTDVVSRILITSIGEEIKLISRGSYRPSSKSTGIIILMNKSLVQPKPMFPDLMGTISL